MSNMLTVYNFFHFWKGIYYMSLWSYLLKLPRHSWLSQIKANAPKMVNCWILIHTDTHTHIHECALLYNDLLKYGIMCFGLSFIEYINSSKCDRHTNQCVLLVWFTIWSYVSVYLFIEIVIF